MNLPTFLILTGTGWVACFACVQVFGEYPMAWATISIVVMILGTILYSLMERHPRV